MSNNKEKLFTEFQAPTTQEWLDKIQVDLKGADFNKKLVWRTNEGFNVQPFYRREDVLKLKTPVSLPGEFPFVRGNHKDDNTWYVRQDILADDAQKANEKALDILNKGVDSLGFCIPGDKVDAAFVDTLLSGILCECVEVNFCTCKAHTLELVNILKAYFEEKGYDKEKLVGSIDFDPIEKLVVKGKNVLKVLRTLPKSWRRSRTILISGASPSTPWHSTMPVHTSYRNWAMPWLGATNTCSNSRMQVSTSTSQPRRSSSIWV